MNRIIQYALSLGFKASSLPLLDDKIYYGSIQDYNTTILFNPWGFPELCISTTFPQTSDRAALSEKLSNCDLGAKYHIHSYKLTEYSIHFLWNISHDNYNHQDILSFIDWFLPLLKDYHATPANICTECGNIMTDTNSHWYNVSGTGITRCIHKKCRGKMEREVQQASALILRKYPTYKRGILGTIIGTIPATLLWAFACKYGDIVIPAGMAIVFLAWLGYTFNCGFKSKWKPLIIYSISLCGILLGYLIHPLFGTPLPSPNATPPSIQLFMSHAFAVFLLICIWITEVAISASNKKSGLSGIIKLK
jgi:hypothetical protein